jgi:hypothetical protein
MTGDGGDCSFEISWQHPLVTLILDHDPNLGAKKNCGHEEKQRRSPGLGRCRVCERGECLLCFGIRSSVCVCACGAISNQKFKLI